MRNQIIRVRCTNGATAHVLACVDSHDGTASGTIHGGADTTGPVVGYVAADYPHGSDFVPWDSTTTELKELGLLRKNGSITPKGGA